MGREEIEMSLFAEDIVWRERRRDFIQQPGCGRASQIIFALFGPVST
jgi:hypothetical protein